MKLHLALVIVLSSANAALGHFVYIVPDATGQEVRVVFSEIPAPDEKVSSEKIAATQLFALDAAGHRTPLKTVKFDHFLSAKVPAGSPVVVAGSTQYGIANSKHTGDVPVQIKYFSKAVLGDPARASAVRLSRVPLEIVPLVRDGKLRFVVVSGDKSAAGADCVVRVPGEDRGERSKTDRDGQVPGQFDKPGRYGVWVRVVDPAPGELQGVEYEKTHTYATLTVDFLSR